MGNVRMAKGQQTQHGPPGGLMSSCVGAERERRGLRPTAAFQRFNSGTGQRFLDEAVKNDLGNKENGKRTSGFTFGE